MVALFFCNHVLVGQSAFPTGYEWVMPRVSQQARVYQRLGGTEIEVIYSRPLVNDREVWKQPGIAPYDKVWRAGANEATIISFSTDVEINGQPLKAGKYAFFVIPHENGEWEVVFNGRYIQWGAFTHNPELDVLRTTVRAKSAEHREAMEISFPQLNANNASMELHWAETKIEVPIAVDGPANSVSRANTTFDWQAGFFAAQYFIRSDTLLAEGLKWANASIAMQENLSNLNQKFKILEGLGRMDEARGVGEYMLSRIEGKEDARSIRFRQIIQDTMNGWK